MKLLIFLFSIATAFSGFAQGVSITDFLATAKENYLVKLDEKQISHLKNTDNELPWIQEMEFRTETNDFELKQQEYRLRLTPNTPRQRKAQRSFHQSNIRKNEWDRQVSVLEALKERYDLVVHYLFADALLLENQRLKTLYLDRVGVLKNLATSSEFDIEELVKAEEEYHDKALEELSLQHQLKRYGQQIEQISGREGLRFDKDGLVTLSVLIRRFENPVQKELAEHVLLTQARSKVEVVEGEYALKKSDSDRLFDYVQAKYGGRRNDVFSEAFSLGIGVILPFKGDAQLELNELELDRITEENKLEKLKIELVEEEKIQTNYIHQLFEEYQMINDQLENGQAQYVYDKLSNTPGVDPLVLLATKEVLLKKERTLKELEYKIYLSYVDCLEISGEMMTFPLRNYLSEQLEAF